MAKRLAIVLSGGGAKGAFQVGVLDALITKHGVKPAIVVGTSTGAIQAMAVAQNDVARLVEVWSSLKSNGDIYKERGGAVSVLFGAKGIYDAKPLRTLLTKFHDPARLKASGIALRLGVVSLQSGEFHAITETQGNIDQWVYASCAMPVFFDPLKTDDKQQWVDGGVRDVTPLGAALDLDPTGVLVIRASPSNLPSKAKSYDGAVSIALRSVGLLQNEVSRNDLANTTLINDMLAARDQMFTKLQSAGMSGTHATQMLEALDKQIAKYKFAQVRVIEPEEEFSDTLEFDPKKIAKAIAAGRETVDKLWPSLQPLVL